MPTHAQGTPGEGSASSPKPETPAPCPSGWTIAPDGGVSTDLEHRLVSVSGINVEAPLAGTLLIIGNDDQPGVIGEVGTILGGLRVNIANFALGRNATGAVGVVNVDEEASAAGALDTAVEMIRKVPAVREAWLVRLANYNA